MATRRTVRQNDENDIRLPVELWVAICGLLSPKDQHSLAKSCTRLFSIVHLNPPSTVVKIDNYRVISTGSKSEDRLHLRSATEVHWSGRKHSWPEKWRLRVLLSVLPTISNLRLLSLSYANINKAQQTIIFGLPTLRTLVLFACQFHPSTKPFPLSCVTALKVDYTGVQTIHLRLTIRRLLTLLATTVESLEVHYFGDPIRSTLQEGLMIELPKLSSFTMKTYQRATSLAILDTFKQYKSITTICILFHHDPSEVSFHHSDLPALRSVTCDAILAVSLIPQRPVTTYVEVRSSWVKRPRWVLKSLSKTRAKITNLKLFVPIEFYSLLPSLATSLQHLEQLTLRGCHNDTPWFEPYALSGKFPFKAPGTVVATLPKLKWVTYWVADYILTDFPIEEVVQTSLVPVCPALEVFECLTFAVCTPDFESGWPPEPKRTWKVRILPDGNWERQEPPPIPTPVPAKKMGAVP